MSTTTRVWRSISLSLTRGLAIQVCYNLSHSDGAYEREVSALKKLPSALECKRRLIITYDEDATIEDNNGKIEVLPYWKWVIA
ncbi:MULTISPECIES: hypothetical protein [Segatella]|uniref:ATP-binding protein n=1 Tax=Segatella bryantii TaxID=77095 RepID=A0AA37HX42_SEGBR|nr:MULTISPECIES: hypothetical protein [Segatella]UKK77656.1 hypothetical protein L6469_07725 [Segatella baroniae B14]GJG28077.1 hypothetical protein PRRU23_17770 [Segatella bryantii]SEQ94064.1 hypothetical protein SAMN05444375_11796 [Segatella baroniae B14]